MAGSGLELIFCVCLKSRVEENVFFWFYIAFPSDLIMCDLPPGQGTRALYPDAVQKAAGYTARHIRSLVFYAPYARK